MNSITVVIPTYNRASSLGRALGSVFEQSLAADQVIVVDDGSSDQTERLISDQYPTVIYHRQENKGVSAARNKGISLATSEWVAFLDSDDQWMKNKLEEQSAASGRFPGYRLVHTDEIWIRDGIRVNKRNKYKKKGGYIFQDCLELCAISPSSVLIERSLLQELGGFDESLPACEDYDLWLKICSRYPVLLVDKPLLYKYGGHSDQLSAKYWGLDRYRVSALDRLLKAADSSDILSSEDLVKAKAILQKKCRILIDGARKRGSDSVADYYQSLLCEFQT